MLPPIRLERLRAGDTAEVAALERSVFGAEAWPRATFVRLARTLGGRSARGAFWLARTQDSALVGYAGIETSALWGEADLVNLAVASRWRRHGVGRRLVEAAIAHCRRGGVSLLWLRVRASNRSARAVYARLGFRRVGRLPGYYEAPAEDAVLMALVIDRSRPAPAGPGGRTRGALPADGRARGHGPLRRNADRGPAPSRRSGAS